MEIRPIRSESDYEEALEEISRLFAAKPQTDDYDRLDILTTLVEHYEANNHSVPPPDPISAIEYEAEKRGLSRKELSSLIGPSGRVSEVLNRRRPLSISMIRKLQESLGISADVLIRPYPTPSGKSTVSK